MRYSHRSFAPVVALLISAGAVTTAAAAQPKVAVGRQPAGAQDSVRLVINPSFELFVLLEDHALRIRMISDILERMTQDLSLGRDARVNRELLAKRSVPQLQQFASNSMASIVRICSDQTPVRRGYVGIALAEPIQQSSAPVKVAPDKGGAVKVAVAFPKVLKVEIGSPAERAGLDSGDVIMKVNGVDPRGHEFGSLIGAPGETLRFQVSSGGQARRVDVQLEPRSERLRVTCELAFTPRDAGALLKHDSVASHMLKIGPMGAGGDTTLREVRTWFFSRSREPNSSQASGQKEGGQVVVAAGGATSLLGKGVQEFVGARLFNAVPAYLARFGASHGVAVLAVVPNSAAARGGLREEDIVTKVRREPVRNTLEFMKMIEAAPGAESIELEIVRDQKARVLTISVK